MRATFRLEGYSATINMIQNVYAPTEEDNVDAWSWGFKYWSGVFEYFIYKTKEEALVDHDALLEAMERYWCDDDREDVSAS